MKIKLVTWNMGYWQYRSKHPEAWKYLRDSIRPDIALLQETRPPALDGDERVILNEIHQGWGTAVYVRSLQAASSADFDRYPTRVVAAGVHLSSNKTMFVVSIHAPIIGNRVFPHLSNIFDDIESELADESCIVGGDLNSARLAEKVWPNYGHGPFFERLDQSWLVDCRKKFYPEEVQTIFRPKQFYPFQDDHIFVSRDLAEKVVEYQVLNSDIARTVSDHIPVVVEIVV